jgi:hypothetical protein
MANIERRTDTSELAVKRARLDATLRAARAADVDMATLRDQSVTPPGRLVRFMLWFALLAQCAIVWEWRVCLLRLIDSNNCRNRYQSKRASQRCARNAKRYRCVANFSFALCFLTRIVFVKCTNRL